MSIELFRENLSMMLARGEWEAQEAFQLLSAKCESPIETIFLAALLPAVMINETPFGVSYWPVAHEIHPQHAIGPYRADFAVLYNRNKTAWMRECLEHMPGTVRIVVECDGHDWHERTKEQAARDKARDRFLTSAGWRVLRFTGSEIHNDAIDCAEQVVSAINNLWGAS